MTREEIAVMELGSTVVLLYEIMSPDVGWSGEHMVVVDYWGESYGAMWIDTYHNTLGFETMPLEEYRAQGRY